MGYVVTNESNLTNIANAIRTKLGVNITYKPSEISTAIDNIQSTYIKDVSFNISQNSNMQSSSTLDVSWLDTSNITNMYRMFFYWENLKTINLSNFNTSKVTNMGGMFDFCQRLRTLNLSNFDTSNVTDMGRMFYYCQALGELDLSNFNTSKVTNMSQMFTLCSSLRTLDISNFDFSNVSSYGSIFGSCGSSSIRVYVKDTTAQNWILNLSSSNRPSRWSTANVIVKT